MTDQALPVIGAALPISALAAYAEWLCADQRDLEIQDPFHPDFLDGDWQNQVHEAKSILDGYSGRMGIHGPFMGINLVGIDPKVRAVTVERLSQGIEIAHALGGSHMVVHSPFEFFGHPMVTEGPDFGLGSKLDQIVETLDPVVELAHQAGVTIVIETIFDTHVRPLLSLVDRFDETVRLSIDVGHAYISHLRGGPSPDMWVREGGPRLAHLHIQDTDGLWDRHWGPGRGNINWYALFEALGTLEQEPRMVLELRDKNDILRAAAWLTDAGFTR